jgi:hypothetical protein
MDADFYHFLIDLTTIAVSLGYPMWQSFNLLEVKKYEKALIQWLAYWIIYSLYWKTESVLLHFAHHFFD